MLEEVLPEEDKMKLRQIIVHYGDNGSQEFWEDEDSQVIMLRNKGATSWTGMLHGRCPNDPVLQPTAKPGTIYPLQGKSLQELIEKIKDHFGIEPVMDGKKMWQRGKNPDKMELKET